MGGLGTSPWADARWEESPALSCDALRLAVDLLVVSGAGLGFAWTPACSLGTRDLTPELGGAASGVINTIMELGGVVAGGAVGAPLQNRLALGLHGQASATLRICRTRPAGPSWERSRGPPATGSKSAPGSRARPSRPRCGSSPTRPSATPSWTPPASPAWSPSRSCWWRRWPASPFGGVRARRAHAAIESAAEPAGWAAAQTCSPAGAAGPGSAAAAGRERAASRDLRASGPRL